MSDRIQVLVGTRKGAFVFQAGPDRATWQQLGPIQLGAEVNHVVGDRRGGHTLLMGLKTGHLGPTVMRSTDDGVTWAEVSKPPAFAKVPAGEKGLAVGATFWLESGHASQPQVWWAGTTPHALFRSDDDGDTWHEVATFRAYLDTLDPESFGETPGGAITHSILIDPRDAKHMYVGLSTGGFFESLDEGATWTPLNKGVAGYFLAQPAADYGQDPHCVRMHPANPDRLYQQNHCGVYRLDRPGDTWERIGDNLPREVGDIGFGVVVHPRDTDTAWVFPMDGTDVWPRTSPTGKPALYRTSDAGQSWERQDKGFPAEQAWWTVYRQALAVDAHPDKVGVYIGTSSGELWNSTDEGDSWSLIARHLPDILSVEAR